MQLEKINCNVINDVCILILSLKLTQTLKLGVTKARAVAIADAVNGPDIPIDEMNSAKLGVNLNGTGLLASNSPEHRKTIVKIIPIIFIQKKYFPYLSSRQRQT